MAADLVIPYNSNPDLDDWGSDSYWPLATWVAWHRGLDKKYGRAKNPKGYPIADAIWLAAWSKQGSYSSPLLAIGQPTRFKDETDYIRKFPLLYEYSGLKKFETGVNPIDATYRGIIASAKAAQSIGGAITDTVENTGDVISSTTKILKYAIPVVLVVAIGGGMLFAYNKYIKN